MRKKASCLHATVVSEHKLGDMVLEIVSLDLSADNTKILCNLYIHKLKMQESYN